MNYFISLGFSLLMLSCNLKKDVNTPSNELLSESTTKTNEIKEEFIMIDHAELNYTLAQTTTSMSGKEVMKLYYPHEVESQEGNEIITIQEKALENGNIIVTLIHDNFLDDSLKGEKHVMELQLKNNKWSIVTLKKNWKCWEGRGHTNWGVEPCL